MTFMMYFVLAVIMSLALTPAAIKLNILDQPNYRKIHEKPIPKGGGIGIFIPVIFLDIYVFLFSGSYAAPDIFKYFTVIFVTFALMTEGMIDDKFELGSREKLFVQIIVTAATLCAGIRFHTFDIVALDILVTSVWIVGVINAVNLIDGLDGLAAGSAVISCIGFVIIGHGVGEKTLILMSITLIGSCLGFLRYNFRPARIFMGDTGSVPLGYTLAILGILCENAAGGDTSIIIPVIMVGIPIFDTLLTIARRALNHKPIFRPDRSHFYNLIMDMKGVEHKNTVLIIYGIQFVLVALSCVLAFSSSLWRVISLCIIAAAAFILSIWMGFIKTDSDSR